MITTILKTHKNKHKLNKGSKEEGEVPDWERVVLPYLFEKELIENQNKCKNVVLDKFIPPRKIHPIAGKFYDKHEQKLPRTEVFMAYTEPKQSTRRDSDGCYPLLESQVYGWHPKCLDRSYTRQLNFICAPKRRCDMTIHGEALYAGRITERPYFNGLRFIV